MTEDADRSSKTNGPLARVKAVLAKATQAVVGIFKRDGGGGATGVSADGEPTERSKKMKDAVEAARKNKDDDDDD